MVLWLVFAGLTALVVVPMLLPLLRNVRPGADPAAHDMAVYAAQLKELAQDQSDGKIDVSAAAEARSEIERRMLALDKRLQIRRAASRPLRIGLAVLLALLVPSVAGSLYWRYGAPNLPDQPLASRATANDELAAALSATGQRVGEQPDDPEAQILYGRTLFTAGRYAEAAEVFERAVGLTGSRPDAVALYGEALVYAAGGFVTAEALQVFAEVPALPRARFYQAVATYQKGDRAGALEAWATLAADAPPGAPWLAAVEARIESVAQELGRDPAAFLPQRDEAVPPPVDMAQVRNMVEGLQARLQTDSPDDLEGWLMLARSLQVLGEMEQATEAWARASALAPDDPDVLVGYGVALMRNSDQNGPLPPAVSDLMARALNLDPDNVDALWFAGVSAAQDGDQGVALAHWRRLLTLLPTDSREYAIVAQQVEGLAARP